jgi:hypothetical protein
MVVSRAGRILASFLTMQIVMGLEMVDSRLR